MLFNKYLQAAAINGTSTLHILPGLPGLLYNEDIFRSYTFEMTDEGSRLNLSPSAIFMRITPNQQKPDGWMDG